MLGSIKDTRILLPQSRPNEVRCRPAEKTKWNPFRMDRYPARKRYTSFLSSSFLIRLLLRGTGMKEGEVEKENKKKTPRLKEKKNR